MRPAFRGKDLIPQPFQTHRQIVRVNSANIHNVKTDTQEEQKNPSILVQPKKTTRSVSKPLTQKLLQQQLTEKWLNSLSAGACNTTTGLQSEAAKSSVDKESLELCARGGVLESTEEVPAYADNAWVLGIDPDVTGALAVLKTDVSGSTAQGLISPGYPLSDTAACIRAYDVCTSDMIPWDLKW
eukprot:Gb_11964 [translate_table: standard]